MADFSWTDMLPFGILMFGGTLFAATRRRAGRALARHEYPKLAARRGLTYVASAHRGGVGRLTGKIDGYEVLVEADERPRVVARFRTTPQIDVRSYEHWKRTPAEMTRLSFGVHELDRWLKNRFASDSLTDQLHGDRRLSERLSGLRSLGRQLKELTVTSEFIECTLDYGSPPYVPAGTAERLLTELSDLAAMVEAAQQRADQHRDVSDNAGNSTERPTHTNTS